MEQVSWDDCQEFLVGLSQRTGGEFRLPTEAEWEYACRAGTTSALNNGKNLTSAGSRCSNLDEVAWYDKNSGGVLHSVGCKKPNKWGLYDMHGYVWEWCQDWYDDYVNEAETDPQGPSSGLGRIIRGGSWYRFAERCRSAYRGGCPADNRSNFLGFRVVMSASQD